MKRELVESYYEAHRLELQEKAMTPEMEEMEKEIEDLDKKICDRLVKVDPEIWSLYDNAMSRINAVEDDLLKEMYIRGFLDYERLVLLCDVIMLET